MKKPRLPGFRAQPGEAIQQEWYISNPDLPQKHGTAVAENQLPG